MLKLKKNISDQTSKQQCVQTPQHISIHIQPCNIGTNHAQDTHLIQTQRISATKDQSHPPATAQIRLQAIVCDGVWTHREGEKALFRADKGYSFRQYPGRLHFAVTSVRRSRSHEVLGCLASRSGARHEIMWGSWWPSSSWIYYGFRYCVVAATVIYKCRSRRQMNFAWADLPLFPTLCGDWAG
jgi:hypothetical protein